VRWLHSLTRITDFSQRIGIRSFAAFCNLNALAELSLIKTISPEYSGLLLFFYFIFADEPDTGSCKLLPWVKQG
jgi:hypothetical protein